MTYLLPLVAALRREGVDACLICLGGGGLAEAAEERGLPVEVLPMAHRWDPRVMGSVNRAFSGARWDVIHAHGMRANLPLRLVRLVRGIRNYGRPGNRPCLFSTVHSDLLLDYSYSLEARLYSALDRATIPLVDTVTCVSGEMRARLQQRGYDVSRFRVIHSGVEMGAVQAVPGQTPPAPGPAGVREDTAGAGKPRAPRTSRRVGTATRLVPVKDTDLLLEVGGILAARVDDLRVEVAGDGPERDRLLRTVEAAGLGGIAVFHGEVRPVIPFLRGLEVYLLTSESEGLPLSVLEAMSVGLPVVATDVGGVSEAVEHGVTGYLVPRRTDRREMAEQLAGFVEELLRDEEKRRRFGEAAARRARAEFSTRSAARAHVRLYRRCLAGKADVTERRR